MTNVVTNRIHRPISRIVVHCSATVPDPKLGVKDIDRWHRERGFAQVGYHYVIPVSGTVQFGRGIERVGAHAQGFNQGSVGICLIGGVDAKGKPADNFAPVQKRALRELIEDLLTRIDGTPDICGHRDLSPDLDMNGVVSPNEWMKACPSFDVRAWWKGGVGE